MNPLHPGFTLDAFQKEALGWIDREHSVLISAPTGAGKTLIAEYATDTALARGENVVYTAPIKALSNQKFRDFRSRYGAERVGILTGDVSIQPDADILIMTTEIYRNSLFEDAERIRKTGWIIFDEIHYLDDPERGTVWEEALLFTPPHIRILALSATVPNVRQLADWIQSVHERPIAVVEESHRPVPLHFMFQCQGRLIKNLKTLRHQGYLNRDDWQVRPRDRRRGIRPPRPLPNRLDSLLHHLIEAGRLPAIYFAFGRRRTELLAQESLHFNLLQAEERKAISSLFQELLERYGLENDKTAEEMRPLIEHGVAYHHAGMLPTLKEVVEQLFTSRLIKLIFTTETFALGINMPARTVVFDELEKYYGDGFRPLTTRDFYQMAGRAGRRGMDAEGYVYVRINPRDISFPKVQRILYGQPESIRSQLNTTYATLLNLYRNLGKKLLELYPRTFHHFQSEKRGRREGYELIERKLTMLREMGYLHDEGLTDRGEFAASLFGYELLLAELHADGVLDDLDECRLNVLISALVHEPRRGEPPPRLKGHYVELRDRAEHYARAIYRRESKYKIHPYTKPPHFNLAPVVEAWTRGAAFDDLFSRTTADEGELVRHFRMMIQLLRELHHAPYTSEKLRQTTERGIRKINRDVVDAEKQLRV